MSSQQLRFKGPGQELFGQRVRIAAEQAERGHCATAFSGTVLPIRAIQSDNRLPA
jgi:hypothetical protein